ncbi:MAG: hypothetical protein QNJ15_09085 [Erythrobacter sp.]|nr:hypothetical protein [Erythrobacter sp.]
MDRTIKTGLQAIPRPTLNRPLGDIAGSTAAQALVTLLAQGGDSRITLDPGNGLNKYLSAPFPRDVLAYSSSTVSDISPAAFDHLLDVQANGKGDSYADWLRRLKHRILGAYELDDETEMVFAPSGTDLEYVALAAVRGRAQGGVHNILLGADEIGSGCIHSAHGRYFARETAVDGPVEPASDVAGIGPVSLVDIPVRCPEGRACSSQEIAAAMKVEIELARKAGQHSLVHCVHGSKTGLVLPNRQDLDALIAEHGDEATFVVDACQARITSEAIGYYLASGCIVLMTGSKFMGAPPFNGWALLPTDMIERAQPLPQGFATIFRKAEWPDSWTGSEVLPDSANVSLALRLEAAVFELERFQAVPMDRIETMIKAFEAALTRDLVKPLGIERILPGSGGRIDDCVIEMRTLATLDVSSLPGMRTFDDAQRVHRQMALDGIRLGQPVKCVRVEEGWGGTLRVGLSMPQLSQWAGSIDAEVSEELASDMQRIAAALQHSLVKTA